MILSYTFRLGSTSAPLSHRPVSVTRCLQRGLSSTGERIRLAQSMNFASHTHRPRGITTELGRQDRVVRATMQNLPIGFRGQSRVTHSPGSPCA